MFYLEQPDEPKEQQPKFPFWFILLARVVVFFLAVFYAICELRDRNLIERPNNNFPSSSSSSYLPSDMTVTPLRRAKFVFSRTKCLPSLPSESKSKKDS